MMNDVYEGLLIPYATKISDVLVIMICLRCLPGTAEITHYSQSVQSEDTDLSGDIY